MDTQGFIDYPSRHWTGRWLKSVSYIIVHSTASSATDRDPWDTLRYLEKNKRGVSTHELVLPGYVYRMVTDERAAQHCWSKSVRFPNGEFFNWANQITWGIEGYQVAGQPTAPDVVDLMVKRVAVACFRLGLNAALVLGHREIDPTRKSDPVGVNMDEFREKVKCLLFRNQHVPERFYDCQE